MLTAADTIQTVGFSADANEVRQSTAPTDVKLAWSLRAQIVATLVGGMLLVCSIVAGWLWRQPFFAAVPAAIAVALLGGPLVVTALRDLVRGRAGLDALVALAVIGAFSTGQYLESGFP